MNFPNAARFLETLSFNALNISSDSAFAKKATRLASKYVDAMSLKTKLKNSLNQFTDQEVVDAELDSILEMYKSGSESEAIRRLRALKSKVESKESTRLLESLIDRASEDYAIGLCNQAIEMVKSKHPTTSIKAKLAEAGKYATSQETKDFINQLQSQLSSIQSRVAAQQGTGCVIPIAIGIGLFSLPFILQGFIA